MIVVARRLKGTKQQVDIGRRQPDQARTKTVQYLIPGDDDEPLTPRMCAVAGINKANESGIHRQNTIARCKAGEPILLVREPDNRYDGNAVALYRENGEQIGYLPREWAEEMAPRLDRGSPVTATITAIEPFETEQGKELLGVRLELVPYKLHR